MLRRNPDRQGPELGRFSDTSLRDLKERKRPTQPTQNLTSGKAKGLLAEKRLQTAVVSLQPLRQTPHKMAAAPFPHKPPAASSATYAARTLLRDRGSRAPAASRKGRGFCDAQGRVRPSTLRLRGPGGPRPEAWECGWWRGPLRLFSLR